MNDISALIKETPEFPSPLPPCEDTDFAVYEFGSRLHILILGFPASKIVRSKIIQLPKARILFENLSLKHEK